MDERPKRGGLFPEDRRRKYPVPSEHGPARVAESELRSSILNLLLRSDIQAAVTDAKTVHTTKGKRQFVYPEGWPDITASIPVTGRAWAIEIKTEEGELRPAQEDKLRELEASGWLVTLARSVEDVKEEMRRQLDHLWKHNRKDYEHYLISLRQMRAASAQRSAVKVERARARRR